MSSLFDGLPDIFVGVFGQAVEIALSGGSTLETTGVFQSRAVDDMGVVIPGAVLHLRDADAELAPDGTQVRVAGQWFSARVGEPDGKGMTPITLEKSDGP